MQSNQTVNPCLGDVTDLVWLRRSLAAAAAARVYSGEEAFTLRSSITIVKEEEDEWGEKVQNYYHTWLAGWGESSSMVTQCREYYYRGQKV